MADTYKDETTGETLEYEYIDGTFYLDEPLDGDLLVRKAGTDSSAGVSIDLSGYSTENRRVFKSEAGSSVNLAFSLDVSTVKTEMRLIPGLLMEKFGLGQSMAALVDAVALSDLNSRFQAEFTIPQGLSVPGDLEKNLKLGTSDAGGNTSILYKIVADGEYKPSVRVNADQSSTVAVAFELNAPESYETFGALKTAIAGMPDDLVLELRGLKIDQNSVDGTDSVIRSSLSGGLTSTATISMFGYTLSKNIDAAWTAGQSKDGVDALLPSGTVNPPIRLTIRTGIEPVYGISISGSDLGSLSASASKAEEDTLITVVSEPVQGYEAAGIAVTDSKGRSITVTDNGNGNYSFSMPGSDVAVTGSFEKIVRPALNRKDHYAYIVGYPDGTVRPQNKITRAEVATVFYRMLTDRSRSVFWTSENSFSDVPKGSWFNNAVSTMSKAGVINGYEDGKFRPDRDIKRAEFAAIVSRIADGEADAGSSNLNDIRGHWAEADIKRAEALGYITGYSDGSFRPNQEITRAEAMTIVNRVLERMSSNEGIEGLLPKNEMAAFSDNSDTSQWYYTAIQEATNSHKYSELKKEKNGFAVIIKEKWSGKMDNRDWPALETEWAKAH